MEKHLFVLVISNKNPPKWAGRYWVLMVKMVITGILTIYVYKFAHV